MKLLTALIFTLSWPMLAMACEGVADTTDEKVEPPPQQTAAGQQNAKDEDVPNNPRHRAIMGKLVETREIAIQGMDDKHVLAKIETPSGHIVIADLGTRQDVKDAHLTAGEQLEVYGVVGRLNERPLLVAEQMGEVVNIKRTSNTPKPSTGPENELSKDKASSLKPDENGAAPVNVQHDNDLKTDNRDAAK